MVPRPVRLRTAISTLAHHRALLDGRITVAGAEFEFIHVSPLPEIFRRMGHELEFDVCELSITGYYLAREFDLPIRAIPVVPRHQFHHADFLVRAGAGIATPRDLEGKRVGSRSWTAAPVVLDRAILVEEHGVDLSTITWVLANREHIPGSEARYPPNVLPGDQLDLFAMLRDGEIDAGTAGTNPRRQRDPRVVPLFAQPLEHDSAQYQRTGIIPVFTCIAVHERVLEGRPWLLEALYEAFEAARAYGLEPDPSVAQIAEGDPVPIGLAANRASFDEVLRLCRLEGIVTSAATVDDLFPPFGNGGGAHG